MSLAFHPLQVGKAGGKLQRWERTTARWLERQEIVPRQFGLYRDAHIEV